MSSIRHTQIGQPAPQSSHLADSDCPAVTGRPCRTPAPPPARAGGGAAAHQRLLVWMEQSQNIALRVMADRCDRKVWLVPCTYSSAFVRRLLLRLRLRRYLEMGRALAGECKQNDKADRWSQDIPHFHEAVPYADYSQNLLVLPAASSCEH